MGNAELLVVGLPFCHNYPFGIIVGQDLVRLLLDKNNGVRPPIRVCGISDSGGGIFSPIGLPLAPLLGLVLSFCKKLVLSILHELSIIVMTT